MDMPQIIVKDQLDKNTLRRVQNTAKAQVVSATAKSTLKPPYY
jgi:hypothetical protein